MGVLQLRLADEKKKEEKSLSWKDYIAIIIAMLTTTLLPIIIFLLILIIVVLFATHVMSLIASPFAMLIVNCNLAETFKGLLNLLSLA
jgi:hypothetical protein